MKVKVTATTTYDVELDPEDYSEEGEPLKSADEVFAIELSAVKDDPDDSYLLDQLRFNGELSDIKIEKLEETAAPAASEAA